MSPTLPSLAALLGCAASAAAYADCPGLKLEQARIPQAPPSASVLAGYVRLDNGGDTVLHIDAVDGADFGSVEMHQMSMDGGMMQMRPLHGLDVPAHGSLVLAEGGIHLMLTNPRHAFKAGDLSVLVFHCGEQTTQAQFAVRAPQP